MSTNNPPLDLDKIGKAIDKAKSRLLGRQADDGHWVFELEADVTIPAEYILYRAFIGKPADPELTGRIAAYLLRKQLPDGSWPLYDEDGRADISASVKAYFALKVAGHSKDEPHMVRARQIILAMGGAAKVNVFTRITLCLFGQMPWRTCPCMPIELVLLPRWFFFHFSKVSYWSRAVVIPLLILYALRPIHRLPWEQQIPELFTSPPDSLVHIDRYRPRGGLKNLFIFVDRNIKRLVRFIPKRLHQKALDEAERWTVEHMRGKGGNGAVFPSMVNAVEALHQLGYPHDHPDVQRGMKALEDLLVVKKDEAYCQPCVSPVWDTCLSLSALAEAGLGQSTKAMGKATQWLWSKQVFKPGDWCGRMPGLAPGGWAFQYENDFYPDLDDTAMVLMALLRCSGLDGKTVAPEQRDRIAAAANWLVGMQSSDGGWGSFDVDNNALYLNSIPFADHGALLDPSTSDLTARCIEALGMLGFGPDYPPVSRGIEFLRKEQEADGSWFGRWGCNYLYGTWSVLCGLRQAGEDMSRSYVRRGVEWLKSRQNPDGGWGETLYSYVDPSLAGQGASTPSQTAWALLGLLAADEHAAPETLRGVEYLLERQQNNGEWDEAHYTGTGFPRVFYLRYHGYARYFPLWALGVFRRLHADGTTLQRSVALSSPPEPPLFERRSKK
ncbi:MAG: squalene--hopene cyclase [Desulfovibrionaceae bacterium]